MRLQRSTDQKGSPAMLRRRQRRLQLRNEAQRASAIVLTRRFS